MPDKKTVNIMTSCDGNLADYIMPQLASIGVNLKQYNVNFYLFHYRIGADNVDRLRAYAETFSNLSFHEVKITDVEPYEAIAEGGGHFWPPEAYFSICCHDYLPEDADRVLYIDAGDVIIHGDISEFYWADFEGKSLIAKMHQFTVDENARSDGLNEINDPDQLQKILESVKDGGFDLARYGVKVRPYMPEDMGDPEKLGKMLAPGIFTSGSYMINVSQFRADKRSIGDFVYLYSVLRERFPYKKMIYLGDQAFMSVAFVGEIKYYGFPEYTDPWYMPYDFGVWYFDSRSDLPYTPIIYHFGGPTTSKPWKARFSIDEVRKYNLASEPRALHAPCYLTEKYVEMFEIWWDYCKMTPIYEEANKTARTAAKALEENFLPLCKWYNDLADEYLRATGKEPPYLMEHKLFKDI